MRITIAAVLAAAAMIVGALSWPAPAEAAGTPGCMTRAEYGRIHHGQSTAKVARIVGASGRVTLDDRSPGYRFLAKDYRVCGSRYGVAYVQWSTTVTGTNVLGVYGKGWYA